TPQYAPNERDIQVTALTTFAEALVATNDMVNKTFIPYSAALKARDTELYFPQTGLFDIAAKVKNYISSLNGALGDTEKKQVMGLTFSKPFEKSLYHKKTSV